MDQVCEFCYAPRKRSEPPVKRYVEEVFTLQGREIRYLKKGDDDTGDALKPIHMYLCFECMRMENLEEIEATCQVGAK